MDEPSRDLRVTVYNSDLGVVRDTRRVDVAAGTSTVEIVDVPARIDPTTVHLSGEGLRVEEQNFQYDLADSDRIVSRYVGEAIDVVLRNGDAKHGRLLSFDAGAFVLELDDGAVHVVQRAQIVDLRLARLPEGLRVRPTLVWSLHADEAGPRPAALSYMTAGMSWHAEYVAVVDADERELSLSAWVSLDNRCGATFENAQLQLVAGDVRRVTPPRPKAVGRAMLADAHGAEGFVEESLFEYHLYTLGHRTTLRDRETKQVALFPSASAPVEKTLTYRGQRAATKVAVILAIENRADRGLGIPLPAGTMRTYKRDARGQLQFIGEDRIGHTAKNETVRLEVGNAFDVVGERIQRAHRRVSERVHETDVEIELRNAKDEPVTVDVLEDAWGHWEVVNASMAHERRDANTIAFAVDVPAEGRATVRYTLRVTN